MTMIIMNGKLRPRDGAAVDIEDRGYQFGDGIYDVIRVYEGVPFLMDAHLKRLEQSAAALRIALPFTRDSIREALAELVRETGTNTGTIYIQVTRGVYPRSQVFPPSAVAAQWFAIASERPRPLDVLQHGVRAIVVEDIRWLRCDIKSLNLIPNTMARETAREHDAYEAIQHRGGMVTEGAFSSLFAVYEGCVWTHPLNNLILPGVTRGCVIDICRKIGIPVREEAVFVASLYQAEEVFLTSTLNEVLPVIQVDQTMIAQGNAGPTTRRLQVEFERLCVVTASEPVTTSDGVLT